MVLPKRKCIPGRGTFKTSWKLPRELIAAANIPTANSVEAILAFLVVALTRHVTVKYICKVA